MSDTNSGIGAYIDRFSEATGRTASWLTLVMVLVTFVIVVMRYVFDVGLIWLQESLTWMHAAVFMLGAAYTLQRDDHVRVDIFYRGFSDTGRAWVDLAGVAIFLLPLTVFLAFHAFDYVSASWTIREISRNAGGLPYPAIPLQKTMLLLLPLTLALQGLSLILTAVVTIRDR